MFFLSFSNDALSSPITRYNTMPIDTPPTPNSSDPERLDSEFTWPNVIGRPEDLELPDGADIFDMKFSEDGSTLILLTKPYIRNQNWQYDFVTWNLANGQRLSHFCNVDQVRRNPQHGTNDKIYM